jgi:hypothetical protein
MTAQFLNIAVPVWQDKNAKQTEQYLTPQAQTPVSLGPVAQYASAAQAISRCGLVGVHVANWAPVDGEASEGPYKTVRDKVVFFCRSGAGVLARVNIPGPLETIFLPDHETVDFDNPLVIAVVNAIFAELAVATGAPIIEVYRGLRQRVRNYVGPL